MWKGYFDLWNLFISILEPIYDNSLRHILKQLPLFQTREEGKALLRQILQLRNQGETPSTEMPAPFFLPASLSANNTPTRRVSPLNLSSVTP